MLTTPAGRLWVSASSWANMPLTSAVTRPGGSAEGASRRLDRRVALVGATIGEGPQRLPGRRAEGSRDDARALPAAVDEVLDVRRQRPGRCVARGYDLLGHCLVLL